MADYVLIYAEPHAVGDGSAVVYEAAQAPATHLDNQTALDWARETIPRQKSVLLADRPHLAKPMVLWRVEPRGKALVWENELGMAVRVAA